MTDSLTAERRNVQLGNGRLREIISARSVI
jgi:hypothetical protein